MTKVTKDYTGQSSVELGNGMYGVGATEFTIKNADGSTEQHAGILFDRMKLPAAINSSCDPEEGTNEHCIIIKSADSLMVLQKALMDAYAIMCRLKREKQEAKTAKKNKRKTV